MSKRRRKKDGLESKVLKIPYQEDSVGKYYIYCNFGFHKGISVRPYVCESRNCNHMQKLYIMKYNSDNINI